jgi:hypothetical protein
MNAGFWWRYLRETDELEELGVDGNVMFRGIFRKLVVQVWTGLIWLRIGRVAGTCECGNEPSGSIKCG